MPIPTFGLLKKMSAFFTIKLSILFYNDIHNYIEIYWRPTYFQFHRQNLLRQICRRLFNSKWLKRKILFKTWDICGFDEKETRQKVNQFSKWMFQNKIFPAE